MGCDDLFSLRGSEGSGARRRSRVAPCAAAGDGAGHRDWVGKCGSCRCRRRVIDMILRQTIGVSSISTTNRSGFPQSLHALRLNRVKEMDHFTRE